MSEILYRAFEWRDVPEIVRLFNLCQEAMGDLARVTEKETRHQWDEAGVDPEQNSIVAYSADSEGTLVAYNLVRPMGKLMPYWGRGNGRVHPDCCGRGIGTALIQQTDRNFLIRAQQSVSPEQPIYIDRWAKRSPTLTAALLESEGYRPARDFYNMQIDLVQPIAYTPLPEGFTLRPFDPERDAEAVFNAQMEAFHDHWGFQETTFEEWCAETKEPLFDPTLWWIAYDQDEVAGLLFGGVAGHVTPSIGWVGILAVRRHWRKRGLGHALLQQSFAEFQKRGYPSVGLFVDAESKSNAAAIYQRAGMYIRDQETTFRKILSGDPARIRD